MTTATKKKPRPKVVRDLKQLPAALGLKKAKGAKPAKPTEAALLQSEHDTLESARIKARLIRGLRHEEDGLSESLSEVRKRIKTETDGMNAILLDVDLGQSRLNLKAPPKKGDEAKAAATKAAHAPVTHPTLSTLLGGKRFVVTRTGEEYVGTVVGSEDRFGPHRSFRGAAEAVCGSCGYGPAAVRALQWEPYEANGKSAPLDGPAPDAPAKDATAESAAK